MTTKEQIISTLRSTGRENIENVIGYMERNGFFTAHCHGHHHYEGGLADHSWQTYQIALAMEEERMKADSRKPAVDKDSLAICALLHDFYACRGLHHISGHGRRSAKILKEVGLHLSTDEFLAIRFHMSLRNHLGDPLYDKARHCHLRYVVHNADHESAKLCNGWDIPLS